MGGPQEGRRPERVACWTREISGFSGKLKAYRCSNTVVKRRVHCIVHSIGGELSSFLFFFLLPILPLSLRLKYVFLKEQRTETKDTSCEMKIKITQKLNNW